MLLIWSSVVCHPGIGKSLFMWGHKLTFPLETEPRALHLGHWTYHLCCSIGWSSPFTNFLPLHIINPGFSYPQNGHCFKYSLSGIPLHRLSAEWAVFVAWENAHVTRSAPIPIRNCMVYSLISSFLRFNRFLPFRTIIWNLHRKWVRNCPITNILFVPWTGFPSALLWAKRDVITPQTVNISDVCHSHFTDLSCVILSLYD